MDAFDACTYKFTPVKYRGEFTPKGRQGAAALALDKFTVLFVGGSYSDGFVQADMVHPNDAVLLFNADSGAWHQPSKSWGGFQQPLPWNLLFCSLVKLDFQNVAVLWSDEGITRISVLNVLKFSWSHVPLCSSTEVGFRIGATLLPKHQDNSGNRTNISSDPHSQTSVAECVLILGGISLAN
jgi:hypothetical protein